MKKLLTLLSFAFIINLTLVNAQELIISKTFNPSLTLLDFGFTSIDTVLTGHPGVNLNNSFGITKVCLNVTHSFIGQLKISLISPSGTEIDLIANRGGSSDNLPNTCFDGTSSLFISTSSPPFNLTYQPEEPLALLNDNGPLDGQWSIKFFDNSTLFQGSVNSYEITFDDNPPVVEPPTNDECVDHISIPVNNEYTCTLTSSSSLSQATDSQVPTSCSGYTFNDDIWFSFTAEDTEHVISVSEINPATNLIYEVFSGSCNNLTSIACSNISGFQVENLTPGNTYYIRVASESSEPQISILDICVSEGTPAPPDNDEYCGAISLDNNNGFCYDNATFSGALESLGINGCQGGLNFPDPNNDIWFKFIANTPNQSIKLSNIVGTSDLIYIQVLSGSVTCDPTPSTSFSNVDCYYDANPGSVITFNLTDLNQSSEYFIRLSSSSPPENTVFDICVSSSNPPTNDNCLNPIELFVDNCSDTKYTLTEASQSPESDPCDELGIFNDDVWFEFTPSSRNIVIDAFNIVGTDDDLMFELFKGDCSELVLELCYDETPNGQITIDNLNTNTRYLLRIASFLPAAQEIDFNLCLKSQSTCPSEVRSQFDYSSYSLRNVLACSGNNSTLSFHPSLEGLPIEFDVPEIGIDDVTIDASSFALPQIFQNTNSENSATLLNITGNANFKNIQLNSIGTNAMKVQVSTGGTLTAN